MSEQSGDASDATSSESEADDAISAFTSVYEALGLLTYSGQNIGQVVTEKTTFDDDGEELLFDKLVNDLSALDEIASFVASGWVVQKQKKNQLLLELFRIGEEDKNDTPSSSDTQVLDKKESIKLKALNLNVNEVLPYCQPAPFGDLKTQTTVIDPKVRKAFETAQFSLVELYSKQLRSRKSIKHEGPPRFLEDIKASIRKHLFNSPIRLHPFKLVVYNEGGFFAPHVDTPTDNRNMVGTLVLCLPTKHTGGNLIVSHSGQSHTIDFAAKCSGRNPPIQWAAFFGDCAHEVKPVTSGSRVVVTYSVIADETASNVVDISSSGGTTGTDSNVQIGPDVVTIDDRRVRAVVEDVREILQKEESMGIISSHKYTLTSLVPERFKGRDKVVYEALKHEGLDIEVVPVAYHHLSYDYGDEFWGGGGEGEDEEDAVYLLSKDHLDYLRGVRKHRPKSKFDDMDIKFAVRTESPGTEMMRKEPGSPSYQGNWVEPAMNEAIYFAGAIIVSSLTKEVSIEKKDDEEIEEI